MELEVVGRHALLFDDDAMAAFVNSSDALVDWNSLQIDRYDVRHLLSAPLPPRRRRNPQTSSQLPDFALESELNQERFLDLPPPSDEPEGEDAEKPEDNSGYHAVAFSYGNTNNSTEQKNAEGELECFQFCPPFAVPESLLQHLPPTEKVHQIIARTAMFVSKHGGQSEIVLRVKQGDNPTFRFLMPDHHLHPYFRFLVDHQELLQADIDGKTQSEDQMVSNNQNLAVGGDHNSAVGGALSLLGSVYGSGEDEDSTVEGDHGDVINVALQKTVNTGSQRDSNGLQKTECSSNGAEKDKDDIMTKHPPTSNKEKAPVLKKNPSIAASKTGIMSSIKQKDDSASSSFSLGKAREPLILEPPSDLKRLIEKIVEFIVKNGKQFETTLREQDSKHGRFPFLLPSNQYHPYYLKVLQGAEESKVGARNSFHGRDDFAGRRRDKRALLSKENDASSLESGGSDLPFESDRKEKFKMVIGKSKKDMQDLHSKVTQQEYGISVDAAAAAAILQAATRGIRNPNLGIISSIAMNDRSQDHGSEVAQDANFRSQGLSQPNNIIQDQDGRYKSSVPVAQPIKGTVGETAGEADSSEAHLTREQKLKAERLKRAKMFVASLKSGAGPSTAGTSRALSAEPVEAGALAAGAKVNLVDKAKDDSSVPLDGCVPEESENTGSKHFGDEYSERRSRRKYRIRSERHDMDDENDDYEDTEENLSRKKHQCRGSSREDNGRREKDEEERAHKRFKRKHQSRHSSDVEDNNNEDRKEKSHKQSRKKHLSRRHSHEDDDDDDEKDVETSYHKHSSKKRSSRRSSHEGDDKGDYEHEKYHKHSRKKHRSRRDSHKHRKESHRRSKHESTSETEHREHSRYEPSEKDDLEEGEIGPKESDQSRGSMADDSSHETSMNISGTCPRAMSQPSETTDVSDDLRAKIRAMLMATR